MNQNIKNVSNGRNINKIKPQPAPVIINPKNPTIVSPAQPKFKILRIQYKPSINPFLFAFFLSLVRVTFSAVVYCWNLFLIVLRATFGYPYSTIASFWLHQFKMYISAPRAKSSTPSPMRANKEPSKFELQSSIKRVIVILILLSITASSPFNMEHYHSKRSWPLFLFQQQKSRRISILLLSLIISDAIPAINDTNIVHIRHLNGFLQGEFANLICAHVINRFGA